MNSLNSLASYIHEGNKAVGWWDKVDLDNIPIEIVLAKLALVHSEISEAVEGFRKDLQDDHLTHRKMAEVELADAIIRILDLAGAMKFDLDCALLEKVNYNMKRADHKRENRAKAGGKKI